MTSLLEPNNREKLLSFKETTLSLTLIDRHRTHYGHRHKTHSDVNVISQLFVWWRNAVPLKGITWLLECMEPWWWVTWLVRWSSAAGFSHDQHTYTITAALKWGRVRGRVAWESMMCLFTFSAGWVNLRSWGFLRTFCLVVARVLVCGYVWFIFDGEHKVTCNGKREAQK